MAACDFLLDPLNPSLHQKVEEKLDDGESFHVAWLLFIKAIQTTSIERFEELKVKIKARLPSQYPGENLEAMAADLCKDARELVAAGQYDRNLTMSMLKNFLLAGGPGNEDFRHPLRDLKLRLSQALLDIGYKDKAAANKYMVEHKLTFKDICEQAESTYRTMYDMQEWPPARNARDAKVPPTGYGINMAAAPFCKSTDAPLTRADIMSLIQASAPTAGGSKPAAGKNGTCHKCGKPGHWKKDCPDLKKESKTPSASTPSTNSKKGGGKFPS